MPRTTEDTVQEILELRLDNADLEDEILDFIRFGNLWKEAREDAAAVVEDFFELEVDEDSPEDYIEAKREFLNIGGSPTSVEFNEFEDSTVYIPSSPYCVKKMYDYLKINYPHYIVKDELEPTDNIHKFTLGQKLLNQYFKLSTVKYILEEGDNYKYVKRISHGKKTEDVIAFCGESTGNICHCVFIKGGGTYLPPIITLTRSEHTILLDRTNVDTIPIKTETYVARNKTNGFYVFDLECKNYKNKKSIKHEMILGGILKVDGHTLTMKDYSKHETIPTMLDAVINNNPYEDEYQLFAHNSGGYDSRFFFNYPEIKIIDEINTNGRMMKLGLSYKGKSFIIKDSMCFISMSLKKMCEMFKTDFKKQDFDCTKITQEHQQDLEFIRYLEYDVKSLAECLIKFEEELNSFNQSITTSLSIPSLTWKIWTNKYPYKFLYYEKFFELREFVRSSIYGGRVFHHVKECNEELVSVDCNSLYPKALCFSYPTGKAQLSKELNLRRLGIHEIVMDAGNRRYPLIPWKESKKSHITFPAGQFQGIYTTIDIISALNAGYKVVKWIQGIHWRECSPIFKNYMIDCYNKRKVLKAEGNPMEQIYKLQMNSFYGKFLENVTRAVTYVKPSFKVKNVKKLKNGQYRYAYPIKGPVRRPIHIGAFVLSYSRYIMNKLFMNINIRDVKYGDTDSFYIPKSLLEKIPQSNELGDFKNDYGDGKSIMNSIFFDYKRYVLWFNDDSRIIKFNGLSKPDTLLTDEDLIGLSKGKSISVAQERWQRDFGGVEVLTIESFYQVNPEKRRIWKGNESWPLEYDFDIEEYDPQYDETIQPLPVGGITNRTTIPLVSGVITIPVPYFTDETITCDKPICNIFSMNAELYRKDYKNTYKINSHGAYEKVVPEESPEFDNLYIIGISKEGETQNISPARLKKAIAQLVRRWMKENNESV